MRNRHVESSYRLFINSPLPLVTKDFVVSAGYVGSRGAYLLTNATSNVRTDFQFVS
jgi:hypothetical protein